MRIEYKSNPNGYIAKAYNGGKSFIDDLEVSIEPLTNTPLWPICRSLAMSAEPYFHDQNLSAVEPTIGMAALVMKWRTPCFWSAGPGVENRMS